MTRDTPLLSFHTAYGGRLVDFVGYNLPISYEAGILKERNACRETMALFDVSHMGQLRIAGPTAATDLERITPADVTHLLVGSQIYSVLTNADGGIIDDLIIARESTEVFSLVINAARRSRDIDHIRAHITATLTELNDNALLALQGPLAVNWLSGLVESASPPVSSMFFMTAQHVRIGGCQVRIARCGYTGEDGFELSFAAEDTTKILSVLFDAKQITPAGLGARDLLRLEAGLCLYGQDIDEKITPVEAGLSFVIAKNRRSSGNFLGDRIILEQLIKKPKRQLIGIAFEGRRPVRPPGQIFVEPGTAVGHITSGNYSPVAGPIALALLSCEFAIPGQTVFTLMRDTQITGHVTRLPFISHNYYRGVSP